VLEGATGAIAGRLVGWTAVSVGSNQAPGTANPPICPARPKETLRCMVSPLMQSVSCYEESR
jgi:hypothetical protein